MSGSFRFRFHSNEISNINTRKPAVESEARLTNSTVLRFMLPVDNTVQQAMRCAEIPAANVATRYIFARCCRIDSSINPDTLANIGEYCIRPQAWMYIVMYCRCNGFVTLGDDPLHRILPSPIQSSTCFSGHFNVKTSL